MTMKETMEKETLKYSLCLFPIRQVSPGRAKWEQIVDEEGQPGVLTLVDPGSESYFYDGYAFIPHPGLMNMTEGMPGERGEVYIKEHSRRARERTRVILFGNHDLRVFRRVLLEYVNKMPPKMAEPYHRMLKETGCTEFFELIFLNTMVNLYGDNPFRYWKQLVNHGFVPYMIGEKLWEGWEQYGGRERDYISGGGYVGTQEFSYSFYGNAQSRAGDGIREVGRCLREKTGGRLNESRAKEFLWRINPLECGRYVCGVKISDRTTLNNGGAGGGYGYKLLYDKEEIYRGIRENGERRCQI